MGDGRLDVARAGARLPAQPVAHDDPARAGDGRPAVRPRARRAALLPPGRRHRGRGDRGAVGRARPPLRPRARLRPRRGAAVAGRGRRAHPAHRPRPDRRRPARRARRHREGRPRRRGDGPARRPRRAARGRSARPRRPGSSSRRGRVRGVETTRGTIATDTVVLCAGIWGPKAARMLGGVRVPLVPVQHQYAYTAPLPELAGETREVVHPILRHQDHSMYFRQHADAYGIGNYRHEPRLTEPEDIRPVGGEMQPSMVPFTDEDFATAARETASLLPAVGRAALTRTFNGLMSFTPDGFPLLGETGVGPRAVARRGDLGHALGRGRQGARRAHDPRRRVRRPPRGRPRALRQPRPQPPVRPRPRRPGLPRGLRHHPPAPAVRAGPRPAAHAVLRARGGPRRAVLRERRLGAPAVVRGQRRAPRRRRRLPAGVGVGRARLVADRGRPSTSPAASASACSTSRRSRRSR